VNARIRSCYLTAPAGGNLHILTEALRRRHIHILIPQEQIPPGADVAKEKARLLGEADLVIGVLTRERRSEWALFELGQAWAQGKRILLFAPPNSAHLPSTLRRFLTVRANLSNREAIEFALDQLLAAPERTAPATLVVPPRRTLGAAANEFMRSLRERPSGRELERLVARALQTGGVEAISMAEGDEPGVDFAIWSDALQPDVGNPLLVEVKAQLPTPREFADAVQRFSKQIAASGSSWGLLLYGEAQRPLGPESLPPNVLVLPLRSLFAQMRLLPFDEIVRGLRNRRVHGGPQ
jgi:hypothetical protein